LTGWAGRSGFRKVQWEIGPRRIDAIGIMVKPQNPFKLLLNILYIYKIISIF
jgi:hypothetical protein